jgi:hypothetical protein
LDNLASEHTGGLPPLQQAQVHLAQLEAVLALSQSLRTLQGEGDFHAQVTDSAVTLAKAYAKKVRKEVASEELGSAKQGLEVNIDAAHRFITHAIPELSSNQKEQLKAVRLSRLSNNALWCTRRKKLSFTPSQKDLAKEEMGLTKRGLTVSINAAHRFITHAISESSTKQKEQLQTVCLSSSH